MMGADSLFGNDLTDEQWAEHTRGIMPEPPGIFNATLTGTRRGFR
jgi:hypothetical protein